PARLIAHARLMLESHDLLTREHGEQLLAFALGWVCHVGTDVIEHSFVNEQCGIYDAAVGTALRCWNTKRPGETFPIVQILLASCENDKAAGPLPEFEYAPASLKPNF
ncbi:MAG TPA: hypothetical protein VJ761_16330, partial [Ktedonobacteraceae bacterium]|nr:hypothetical protein [Ktedonobacteraceae bacterium]